MKRITISIFLLVMTITTFSQQNDPAPLLTKQDYLKKSKKPENIRIDIPDRCGCIRCDQFNNGNIK